MYETDFSRGLANVNRLVIFPIIPNVQTAGRM